MTTKEKAAPVAPTAFRRRTASQHIEAVQTQSVQRLARLAAILYLVIAVVSGIAHGFVPSQLLVSGDAAATASNFAASPSLLPVGGVGSELVILLSEVVLSVLLYVLFRPVNRTVSLLAAVSRLAMTTIHGLNLLNYFFAWQFLGGADILAVFSTAQRQAFGLLFLDAHHYGFQLGIAFLVPHVLALAYLIYTSGYLPKLLGVLFALAGLGYLIDTIGQLMVAGYGATPAYIALPIIVSEIAFPLWLLIKGVNVVRWEQSLQFAS